jgi:hypothetical protein
MPQKNVGFSIPVTDDRPLLDLRFAGQVPDILALAQNVGLFEYLSHQSATIQEIADHFQVAPRAAEAVMAVAAAAGFLECTDHRRFGLTELSRTYLLPASPFFRKLSPSHERTYEDLKEAFHSDEPIKPLAVTMDVKTEDEIRSFIESMHTLTLPAAGGLARQEIFTRIRHLLDVAGGSGSLVSAIADHNPNIRCTLLDFDAVCAIARKNIASFGLEDRITTFSANMFHDPWPSGHDAILFGNIFHDWDVDACKTLAQRAYDALEPGGHILLHEMPLNETKDGPLTVACFSIAMLLYEKGKQYTLSEFESILTEAGFTEFQSVPSYGYYHLVCAKKQCKT